MKGPVIAKTQHRTFEIYAIRDEAIRALTPKNPEAFDHDHLHSSTYRQLSVSALDLILHVQFAGPQYEDAETLLELQEDFLQFSQNMAMNSKVLIDFHGVEAFSADSIELIAEFNKRLRNKGSRVVLCCIAPEVLVNFFPTTKRTE